MSGHSKWHNIQKTKGAADAKRSAAFTKIAKEIIVAVKQGGSGDPANNSRLATVIAKAKAANMPNDNIKRTIDKALGAGNTDNYESVTYEGYGPCGVAVIVEALTDNRHRTGNHRQLCRRLKGVHFHPFRRCRQLQDLQDRRRHCHAFNNSLYHANRRLLLLFRQCLGLVHYSQGIRSDRER